MDHQRVGVAGGGTAGSGIARALAQASLDVVLCEATSASLARARDRIRDGMDRDIARWAITEAERDAALARVSFTTDPSTLSGAGLVIEAIQEVLDDKQALLGRLAAVCDDDVFLYTNSSTLSVTELAEALPPSRRSRFAGLHFIHPVTRVAMVEIVRARESGAEVLERARELARTLGKEAIEVAEYPGYVTTRLTLALVNEAVTLLMEGVATRDAIDRAMRLRFGLHLGPLALADEMGLDSVFRSLESLWTELGLPQYRPCPLLRSMVTRGWLGEKSGRGFYHYGEGGRRLP